MKIVKNYLIYGMLLLFALIILGSCKSVSTKNNDAKPVVISNDSLEYQIIILDIGFDTYLASIAKPMNFYSPSYYRIKNANYVAEWNIRVRDGVSNRAVFEQEIPYDPQIDYGLEVDYKLYNYFKFVTYKYKIRFSSSSF